jgi:ornithine carbamoyltransferase
MRHFLTIRDFSSDDLEAILSLAADLKRRFLKGQREPILQGRVLGLLFSKPSLRTRVSFEAGMAQLGGSSLYLGSDVGWLTRESPADFARVISQYLDFIVCRTHSHQEIELLAQHSACSVINGLTSQSHPCQALADLLTLRELKGDLKSCKLAYIGDGNNVARSLALACDRLGATFTLACPQPYQLDQKFVASLLHPDKVSQTDDPFLAVEGAAAVYTDVWSSMGYEDQTETRRADFAAFQVNSKLMSHAPPDAIFLHCLPAHRGEEVTDDVIDGQNSAVIQQAANRLHAQKGLLVWLSSDESSGGT